MSDRSSPFHRIAVAATPPTTRLSSIISTRRSRLRWLIGVSVPAALLVTQLLPMHQPAKQPGFAAAPALALISSVGTAAGDAGLSDAALTELSADTMSGVNAWGAPRTASRIVQVTADGTRLRSGPGTTYTIRAKLDTTQTVTLLGQVTDWYKVRTQTGREGWISGDLLHLTTAATDGLRTIEAPTTPTPHLGHLPTTKNNPVIDQPAASTVTEFSTSFGRTAASIALSKVGRPYVWGASGPRAFDCSGLLVYTYRQLGIALPHSSSAMFSSAYGHVIRSTRSLQPGDILFFRNTAGWGITHVAMYAGHGMMVTANSPRSGVRYQSLYSSYWQRHWAGAVRPYQR
ncbi:MAG: C40 family peptidase [Herpetosiphonaceae bacterium]|nr:C40 family peptidase [Herpetosiphonaceae bacterium]